MDMSFLLHSLVFILCTLGYLSYGLAQSNNNCNLPPKYWCLTREIAEKCEVTDACKKNVWNLNFREAPPFSLELYYEALCPFCKEFITGQLYPVYKMAGPSLFNLTLIPFGNAVESWNGTMFEYSCQHGPKECLGNLIETCGLHLLVNKTEQMAFIHCMENKKSDDFAKIAEKCALKVGLQFTRLKACFTSDEGNKLQHEMAARTNSLSPAHKYVPWVVVNGIHNDKIEQDATTNLLRLFCDSYQGQKPDFCIPGNGVCLVK